MVKKILMLMSMLTILACGGRLPGSAETSTSALPQPTVNCDGSDCID